MWRTFPVRRMAAERIFLAVFFLYIKKYATWCLLSQQTIVPNLTIGLTFNVYRVSSVSSSSSRQSQTSAGGTACSRLPRLAVIFPGSYSFPSEASPSSSALVYSPRRRPPVLSTWSTTKRNKEMTVHGEDDSRDPAARVVILFFQDGEGSTRLSGTRGPSSPDFYFICLSHDQPSLFFPF